VSWAIRHRSAASDVSADLAGIVRHFDWETAAPRYDDVLEHLTGGDR